MSRLPFGKGAVAGLVALATLTSCKPVTLPPPAVTGEGEDIRVEERPVRLLIGRGGIPIGRLAATLSNVSRGRPGILHLTLYGRDRAGLRAVIATARRAGVDPFKIHVVPGSGPRGAVEVIASRFAALAPVCPSLAIVGPSVNDNDFEPTLGCSTRRNLAAMIDDPADLLGSDAVVPGDGAAAVRAIERYRGTQVPNGHQDHPGGTVQTLLGGGPPPLVLGAGGPVSGGAQP